VQLVEAQRLGPCPLVLKTRAAAAAELPSALPFHSFWLVFFFPGPWLKISNSVYLEQNHSKDKKGNLSNFVKSRPHVPSKQQNQLLKAVLLLLSFGLVTFPLPGAVSSLFLVLAGVGFRPPLDVDAAAMLKKTEHEMVGHDGNE